MIIELIIALLVGVLIGTITGLTPGIHINLVAFFLLSALAFLHISPIALAVFIVSMSICHTAIDFIPSIFLGAPDEDSVLSVLPGHEMLIKGEGYEAVILTLYGSIIGIFLILLFTPLFVFFLPKIYDNALTIMPFILILASLFLFYFEKKNRLWAIIIFFLAGFLGIASMNLSLKEPLLPLLTGLFGASSLITSISKKQKLPKQRILKLKQIKIPKSSFFKTIFCFNNSFSFMLFSSRIRKRAGSSNRKRGCRRFRQKRIFNSFRKHKHYCNGFVFCNSLHNSKITYRKRSCNFKNS